MEELAGRAQQTAKYSSSEPVVGHALPTPLHLNQYIYTLKRIHCYERELFKRDVKIRLGFLLLVIHMDIINDSPQQK